MWGLVNQGKELGVYSTCYGKNSRSQTGGMISSMLLNLTLATECKNGFKSTRMEAGRRVTGAATAIHTVNQA